VSSENEHASAFTFVWCVGTRQPTQQPCVSRLNAHIARDNYYVCQYDTGNETELWGSTLEWEVCYQLENSKGDGDSFV